MSGLLKLKTGSLRSDVWDHFEKGEKTAKCKHCDRELSFCGGTTNLRDHLLRNHGKQYQSKKDKDVDNPASREDRRICIEDNMLYYPFKENNTAISRHGGNRCTASCNC